MNLQSVCILFLGLEGQTLEGISGYMMTENATVSLDKIPEQVMRLDLVSPLAITSGQLPSCFLSIMVSRFQTEVGPSRMLTVKDSIIRNINKIFGR